MYNGYGTKYIKIIYACKKQQHNNFRNAKNIHSITIAQQFGNSANNYYIYKKEEGDYFS